MLGWLFERLSYQSSGLALEQDHAQFWTGHMLLLEHNHDNFGDISLTKIILWNIWWRMFIWTLSTSSFYLWLVLKLFWKVPQFQMTIVKEISKHEWVVLMLFWRCSDYKFIPKIRGPSQGVWLTFPVIVKSISGPDNNLWRKPWASIG